MIVHALVKVEISISLETSDLDVDVREYLRNKLQSYEIDDLLEDASHVDYKIELDVDKSEKKETKLRLPL